MTTGTTPHVVVIGGGIAGLAAAFFLAGEPVRVTVLEGSPRLGGKLSASDVAGVSMDEGAEALLARRPEGIGLIEATGLAADLVPAGVTASAIYTRGAMRSLPRRQFMGVPADIDELASTGVVSAEAVARARRRDRGAVRRGGCVGHRLHRRAAGRRGRRPAGRPAARRRLRRPLRGPVVPGHAGPAGRRHPHPRDADRGRRRAPAAPPPTPSADNSKKPAPIFVTLTTGLGALPEAVAKASGADIRVNAMVRELSRTASGWRLTIGSAADPEYVDADAVILAAPAAPAARLLKGPAAAAAAELAQIPYASMAIITLAFLAGDFPAQQRSGYLVPAVDGRAVKAATFSTIKWPHLAKAADPGNPVHIVRCSVGRSGDVAVLQRDDADLAALAAAELADSIGRQRGAGCAPGHPLGRRAAPVQRRPPGPGRADPRRRGGAARNRGGGGRLRRRRRHPAPCSTPPPPAAGRRDQVDSRHRLRATSPGRAEQPAVTHH